MHIVCLRRGRNDETPKKGKGACASLTRAQRRGGPPFPRKSPPSEANSKKREKRGRQPKSDRLRELREEKTKGREGGRGAQNRTITSSKERGGEGSASQKRGASEPSKKRRSQKKKCCEMPVGKEKPKREREAEPAPVTRPYGGKGGGRREKARKKGRTPPKKAG